MNYRDELRDDGLDNHDETGFPPIYITVDRYDSNDPNKVHLIVRDDRLNTCAKLSAEGARHIGALLIAKADEVVARTVEGA